MPLFFADSFVLTTHFDSDLLTNRSHTPYPLCFLIFSFTGRCSPIWANNRVDTSSHTSLFHVFKCVAGGVSPQLCYLRKSSALLLHIGAYSLVRGQLQIVSSHPDLSSFLSRLSCAILVSSLDLVGLWTIIQQEIRLSEGMLRDMMGEKRQGVLMGSILLYTTMKIPTITWSNHMTGWHINFNTPTMWKPETNKAIEADNITLKT